MVKGNSSKDVGKKEQKVNDGEGKVSIKAAVKIGSREKVRRKAITAKTKRKNDVDRRSEGGRRTEVVKGRCKKVYAQVPIPKVTDGRGFGYLYNKEVVKFRTQIADESFRLAGVEFNNNFKCSYDLNRKLFRKDSTHINSDNKTYTFTCGCGRTDLVLLFRLFNENNNEALERKEFLYHVFVKKEKYEETLLHFNYSVERQKKTIKKKKPQEETICNTRAVGTTGGRKSGTGRKVETKHFIYSHRNVEKFFEMAKLENGSRIVKKRQMGPVERIQYVSDGSLLTYESLKNGVLTLQYPILITDVPESIGLEVNIVKGRTTTDSIR
jgi:hypothetical protein